MYIDSVRLPIPRQSLEIEPTIIITGAKENEGSHDEFVPNCDTEKMETTTLAVVQSGDSDWSNVSSRDVSPSPHRLRDPVSDQDAATKIQAVFRGFKTRKALNKSGKPTYRSLPRGMQNRRDSLNAAQTEARRGSLTRDILTTSVLEKRVNEEDLTRAVVTLQAGVRGYLARKHTADKKCRNFA